MKRLILLSLVLFFSSSFAAEPNDLQELLEQVKKERSQEKEALAKRELTFKNTRNKQKGLLSAALKNLEKEETRSASLRKSYDSYDLEIARKNAVLKEKMGGAR